MATEIASAYIALYTKMPGVKADIARDLGAVDGTDAGVALGQQTGTGFTRGFALAGAVGGLVATIAGTAAVAVGNLVGDAVAASDASQKFVQSLTFAGLDTTTIDKLAKSTREYADQTVYSLSDVQSITSNLAGAGIKDYDKLAMALGNFNAVAGGSSETYGRLGSVLTQTAGAGKLTTENWNQITDAVGGSSVQIQKSLESAGAYTGNFRDAMEKGQITAEEFNTALLDLGTQPVAVEAAKSTATMEGAVGNLSATIVGGLSDAITGIKPQLTGFVNGLSASVGWIKDNINWLGPLVGIVGGLALAIGVWNGVMALGTVIKEAGTVATIASTAAQWLFNIAMDANPIGLIILAIAALIAGIILLVMNWDTVVKFLGDTWNGFVGWFTGVLEGFAGWWSGVWDGIVGFATDIWQGYVDWVLGMWAGFFGMMRDIGTNLTNWWNGLWSGLGSFVQDAFRNIGNFVVGILNTVINLVNGALSGINDMGALASNITGGTVGWHIGLLPHIPQLADGALVSARTGGTLAAIGEGRYDEAVMPLGGPQLEKIRNALGSPSGKTDLSDATIDKLARALAGYVRVQSRQGATVG